MPMAGGEPHLFCGLPVKLTLPYCPCHCARAYRKPDKPTG
jgi:hypothetical protein